MAKSIGDNAKLLRAEVSPRIKESTRADLLSNLQEAEKKYAAQAVEVLELFSKPSRPGLEDWDQLLIVANAGNLLCQMRLAFTEIPEVKQVVS